MIYQRAFRNLLSIGALSALAACGTWSNAQSIPSTTVAPSTTTTIVETGISASGQRSGPSAQASQLKLLELGFWLADPNGKFDDTTTQAVMAFQKYFQLRPTGSIGSVHLSGKRRLMHQIDTVTPSKLPNSFVKSCHASEHQGRPAPSQDLTTPDLKWITCWPRLPSGLPRARWPLFALTHRTGCSRSGRDTRRSPSRRHRD